MQPNKEDYEILDIKSRIESPAGYSRWVPWMSAEYKSVSFRVQTNKT